MKKYFLTFGGGAQGFRRAAKNLSRQVKKREYFDEIICYTDYKLFKKYSNFYNDHKEFILNNKRGFGYWIWKPFLILKTLRIMQEGDLLFYADGGCWFPLRGRKEMEKIFSITQNKKPYFFYVERNYIAQWVKNDLISSFDLKTKEFNNLMIPAGIFVIKKLPYLQKIIQKWFDIATKDNYHYVSDAPSYSPNHPSFIEHRHDMSIITCLVYKYKVNIASDVPWIKAIEKSPLRSLYCHFSKLPILPMRDKNGRGSMMLFLHRYYYMAIL